MTPHRHSWATLYRGSSLKTGCRGASALQSSSVDWGETSKKRRVVLPSAVPYIATGLRISSTVALILAFTAELFLGIPGLGQKMNFAQAYGLNDQLYALALAVGFLGLAIHLIFTRIERRALRWHPSQRGMTA